MLVRNARGGAEPHEESWGTRPPPTNPGRKAGRDERVCVLGGLCPPTNRRGPTHPAMHLSNYAMCSNLAMSVVGTRVAGGGTFILSREKRAAVGGVSLAIVPTNIQPLPSGR